MPYSVCGLNKVNATRTSTDSITGSGTLFVSALVHAHNSSYQWKAGGKEIQFHKFLIF